MRTFLGAAACAAFVAGCGPSVTGPIVTYVPTHTPGLKYVIVDHPGLAEDYGEKLVFSKASEYILLCDGRPVDGMHCSIPPEVGQHNSVGPTAPQAPAPVPVMVGALAGHTTDDEHHKDSAAPPAAPVVPVIPAVTVPVPVKAAPAPKGGK